MNTPHHTGSCLCGAIRFEITGSFESFYLCHCNFCRKDTGSAHAANLFSSTARFAWVSGSENVQSFSLPETRHMKSFCRTCGAALPSFQMDGDLLVVPAGSLDSPIEIRPNAHIFCSSRASWDECLDEIPAVAGAPG
jgi:hypothetical protein